jgi:hypothetical protein
MPKVKDLKPKKAKKKVGKKAKNVATGSSNASSGFAPIKVLSKAQPNKVVKLSHHKAICSITDPFCIHAKSAQRPDGSNPSIPFQVRYMHSVGADGTTGASYTVFIPGGGFYSAVGATNTGGPPVTTATTGATWVTGGLPSFISTNAKEIRIVSFGCIIRTTMSATTAKGQMFLSSEANPLLSTAYNLGNMYGVDCQVHTMAPGTEVCWRSKPLGPTAHNFRPAAEFTNNMTNFDWTSLVVQVTGGDTTTSIQWLSVEYVMNIEFTVNTTGVVGLGQLQKPAPPANNIATKVADKVHAETPSFIQGGIDKAVQVGSKWAMDAIEGFMSDGLALLFA